MSSLDDADSAFAQKSHRLAASESAALGLQIDDNDSYDDEGFEGNADTNDEVNKYSPPPFPSASPTHRTRTEYEEQIERNERRDEVEPGLTEFRKKRDLHVRQLNDLTKKSTMVGNRIDKLNDDVEKLRQQWGELEREKAALLVSSERYEQRLIEQEKKVHRDDVRAKKYHDYLTLVEEVLMLDEEDDDEEDGDGDRMMFDWAVGGHGGGEGRNWTTR